MHSWWPLTMKIRTTHTDRCRIRCILGFYILLLFLFQFGILISHCIVGISIEIETELRSWKNFSRFLYRLDLLPCWLSKVLTAWNEFQRIILSHPIDSIKGHWFNDELKCHQEQNQEIVHTAHWLQSPIGTKQF